MSVKIYVTPNEVWGFFDKNFSRLQKEMVGIATNEDTGYTVFLTEDNGCPLLYVYREETKVYEEGAVSMNDCEKTVKAMYLKYLFPLVVCKQLEAYPPKTSTNDTASTKPDDSDEEEFYEELLDDKIYEREDELYLATTDFLEVVLNCTGLEDLKQNYGDIINDFLDDMCTILAQKYSVSVYRPTWIPDEMDENSEVYVEYPYLELDDYGVLDEL